VVYRFGAIVEVLIDQVWKLGGEGGSFGGVGRSWGFKWKHFKCAISLAQVKSSICPHAKLKFGPEFAFWEQKQVQFLGPFKTQIPPLSVSKQDRPIYYRVTPKDRGIPKIKGLEQGSIVEFSSAFWECPPLAGAIAKNKAKAIMNLNIHKSQGAGGEGPYTYSWRVGRILHPIGVGSLPLVKIRGQIHTHKSWYYLIDWTLSLLNSLILTTMKGMWYIPSTQPSKNNACDIPSTQLSKNTMHVWGYRTCQLCDWKMLQNF
jgi:hypothetical protein